MQKNLDIFGKSHYALCCHLLLNTLAMALNLYLKWQQILDSPSNFIYINTLLDQ